MSSEDAAWIEEWQISEDEWAQLRRPERGVNDDGE